MKTKSSTMTHFMTTPCGTSIAYDCQIHDDAATTVCFLPGFMSNKKGTKAQFLAEFCQDYALNYHALDYRGHGASGGNFQELTLSDWLVDCERLLAKIDQPLILVGSSMGGWLSLLLARRYAQKVAGLVLLAPAPDFTVRLMQGFTPAQKDDLQSQGFVSIDSGYETPHIFTCKLIEDGEKHLVSQSDIALEMPVSILQGKKDTSVLWQETTQLLTHIQSPMVRYHLIEKADHGLSRPEDLALLAEEILRLSAT
ncbi:MAG: alpha/beta hydrolase [Alphaproteobacteria bacterium]|nr:MAG: alpha/beta hydrolase [Alphaproteobacteria bacterium]